MGKTSQAKVEATSGREYASESRAYGARVSHGKHQWRTVTRRASAEGSCRGAAQDPAVNMLTAARDAASPQGVRPRVGPNGVLTCEALHDIGW